MRTAGLLLTCLLAAGCGGSGDASQNSSPGPGIGLGERGLPGYHVRVERLGTALPGADITVLAVITGEPGYGPPVEVAAALQASAPTSWTAGTLAGGGWTWNFTVPAGLEQRVWIRVLDADGNTAESGSEDFSMP
jgi:hypothetical protein